MFRPQTVSLLSKKQAGAHCGAASIFFQELLGWRLVKCVFRSGFIATSQGFVFPPVAWTQHHLPYFVCELSNNNFNYSFLMKNFALFL